MRRACCVTILIALGAPALAQPPKPQRLPHLMSQSRQRGPRPVVVIAPTTPARTRPPIGAGERAALAHRAATTTGLARIAALDDLTLSLENFDAEDEHLEAVFAMVAAHYVTILTDPALDTYPYADELLVRGAHGVWLQHDALAMRACERVLARYPASRFRPDARLMLGKHADGLGRWSVAKQHFAAVIAARREPFVQYARLQLAWTRTRAGEHAAAVAELTSLATDPATALLHEPAIDSITTSYAHAGRADLAPMLFESVDRGRAADRLRVLAGDYATLGKHTEAIATLRAAIARDGDRTAICLDRVDIVRAMATAHNRADAEVAVAELAQALPFAEAACAAAADDAVGELAYRWHAALKAKDDRAPAIRMWTRAAELATTDERKTAALRNRDALR